MPCTALVHRGSSGDLVVEFERNGEQLRLSVDLERFVPALVSAASLQSLCDEAAQIFRSSTGYDRVMIYRFDEEGHGEVFAETESLISRLFSETGIRRRTFPRSRASSTSAIG